MAAREDRPSRRWRPASTVGLRLTALYGAVFLLTGAILLTLGYLLVRNNVNTGGDFRQALARLGLRPRPPGSFRARGFPPGSTEFRLVAAVAAQLRAHELHRLLIEYLGALGAMTAVSVGAGWLLAGRALRPLRRITATARRVSGENLGERIALQGPADELKELADTFDGMLGRLDTAFASQRHFVANASHELRTPLAIMRTELDVALADPDSGERELRRTGEELLETIDRCERLIESLLVLARSEAATGGGEVVDLATLAGDCITDLAGRGRELGLRIEDDLESAWAFGEPALLERMIANLVDNAIRYNKRGGVVEVRTGIDGSSALVAVRNSGPVVRPEDAQRLTEPFERVSRAGGGFGLGLSIVASFVAAHSGTLAITPHPEGGLSVSVRLPLAAHRPAEIRASQESSALTRS